ncbi:DUF1093 domain-containing protein [Enterococcus sp.]|uniref:DUF1093 domain-containing protein n=1 Tax=Enterococcus sp. TaxID=35783 RepID=UPI0028A094DF|nr:DUF1093 domain-containing protein [Enterococcus sp.]
MKKILVTLGVLILAIGGYFGYKYYANTYQAVTAYALTPEKIPTAHQTVDQSGNKIDGYTSYDYTFEFVKKNGEKEIMTYELSGENVTPYAPNTLIKAEISHTHIVSGPNEIKQSEIPATILAELE